MKSFIIFVIASVFSANVLGTTIVNAPIQCSHPNETYVSCYNGCEFTCANYAVAGACAGLCDTERAGCYCNWQYVRNRNNVCVAPNDCSLDIAPPPPAAQSVVEPQTPYCKGQNEIFIPCGVLCPLTCATKNIKYKCKEGCQPGCFCAKGYLRNSKNKCVPLAKCD